jgi:hypothetical protein
MWPGGTRDAFAVPSPRIFGFDYDQFFSFPGAGTQAGRCDNVTPGSPQNSHFDYFQQVDYYHV